ncbi:ABC transporter [Marinicella pacifica]|uniref:ABC transporter n=1 Tax=Marinicella pacifica TaxID=1171543 RepID=A0A917FJK1_9GAMM|nr:ABC transporter ATP-binding protein [Marinicella pacifica]GGF84650.1 ABC transporter [Marinicella pacifica]
MNSGFAITTRQLSKQYGAQFAVQNLDVEIKKNITTGLIGPNGAGKTTLMSLICGFIKPSDGTVNVLGQEPNAVDLKSRVSILPQDAHFLKSLSVKVQLTMLAELQGFAKQAARKEALRVLDLVDLIEAQNKLPEQMSHGMLKRCAIAQALMGEPELILLDEPTAGLDPSTTDNIKAVIKNLQNKATIIISSHNLSVIEDLCHEVVILDKGRLHAHREIDQIVVKQQALTIKLTDHPTAEQLVHLKAADWVKDIKVGKPGSCVMVVYYDPQQTDGIEISLLQVLKDMNMGYREFTKGERLQEYMTDNFK